MTHASFPVEQINLPKPPAADATWLKLWYELTASDSQMLVTFNEMNETFYKTKKRKTKLKHTYHCHQDKN